MLHASLTKKKSLQFWLQVSAVIKTFFYVAGGGAEEARLFVLVKGGRIFWRTPESGLAGKNRPYSSEILRVTRRFEKNAQYFKM